MTLLDQVAQGIENPAALILKAGGALLLVCWDLYDDRSTALAVWESQMLRIFQGEDIEKIVAELRTKGAAEAASIMAGIEQQEDEALAAANKLDDTIHGRGE